MCVCVSENVWYSEYIKISISTGGYVSDIVVNVQCKIHTHKHTSSIHICIHTH